MDGCVIPCTMAMFLFSFQDDFLNATSAMSAVGMVGVASHKCYSGLPT